MGTEYLLCLCTLDWSKEPAKGEKERRNGQGEGGRRRGKDRGKELRREGREGGREGEGKESGIL